MQLRSTIVAVIIAAAAGASAVRAFGPHSPGDAAAVANGERRSPESFAMAAGPKQLPAARAAQYGTSSATAIVYVAGAVARPGVYTLPASARANDALHAAGGPAADADLVAVNLAAHVADGDEVAVPLRGANTAASGEAGSLVTRRRRSVRVRSGSKVHRRRRHHASETPVSADAADVAAAPTEIVDVNAATETELETLPGVGPSLAERIVAFRDLNGPFASSDELLDVGGMTAAKVDALSPYVGFR